VSPSKSSSIIPDNGLRLGVTDDSSIVINHQVPMPRSGQKIVKSTLQSNTCSTGGHSQDSEGRSCPGEFDSDEDEDMLEKVKASKRTVPVASTGGSARYIRLTPAAPTAGDISVARHTAKVRTFLLLHDCQLKWLKIYVKLMKIMSPPTSNHQVTGTTGADTSDDEIVEVPAPSHKQSYIQADLPFPCGGNHCQVWAKTFRPALLSWAGSQDDPFGANGIMHDEISCLWGCLYPDIELDSEKMPIVVGVVCHTASLSITTENDY